MITELLPQCQIKIPAAIISNMGLHEGDEFEIFENNGMITMIPVVTYPSEYISKLNDEIKNVKENIKAGKQPIFDSVDSLIEDLENSWCCSSHIQIHPSLRTKRIQGTDGLFEFSVNMDIRVIWFYENNSLVALIDVGHHNILKNFWHGKNSLILFLQKL